MIFTDEALQYEDDFHTKLPSSYEFNVQPVDLVKLKSIRTTKINKKRDHLFEKMGLPLPSRNKRQKRKIFLKRRSQVTCNTVGQDANILGNLNFFLNKTGKYILY